MSANAKDLRNGTYRGSNYYPEYHFNNGQFMVTDKDYDYTPGQELASGSYSIDGDEVNLSSGESYAIIDECRVIIDDEIYLQQEACYQIHATDAPFYSNGSVLTFPVLFFDDGQNTIDYALKFELISNPGEPMRFQLTEATLQDDMKSTVSASYNPNEIDPTKKLTMNSEIYYVNEYDHLLKFSVEFTEISNNPYIFEVSNISLSQAFQFDVFKGSVTTIDVSDLYQL
jgi:hypothetical protein